LGEEPEENTWTIRSSEKKLRDVVVAEKGERDENEL